MSLPRSQHIAVKAGSVEYLSFGGPDSAETAVLLHASATGAPMLAGLAERLAKGRRVLVPNLDGYGATKIDCPKCPATFRHVQTVEQFLHALKIDDIHLIGHSMGGLIALRVARRARFRLKSLTLIEPMAFGTLDREADREAIAYDRTMIMDFLEAVEAGRLEEGISSFTERVSHQKWTDLSERVQGELLGVLPQIVDEAPLVSCDDLSARDLTDIGTATLLLGTQFGPPPAAPIIQRIAAAVPNARHEMLSGVGHMAPVSHPTSVADAVSRFYLDLEG